MKEEIKNLETSVYRLYKNSGKLVCQLQKSTMNENSSVNNTKTKTKQNRLMFLLNCAIYGKKKSTFIKNKELQNFNNI